MKVDLILCADREWRSDRLVGGAGYQAKVFRTLDGAERRAAVRGDSVRTVVAGLEAASRAEGVSACNLAARA